MKKLNIAIDLDGTLAHYEGWKGVEHIGDPIPKMMNRVLEWIAAGHNVEIFTSRVSDPDLEKANIAAHYIQKWLIKHGIGSLEISCIKKMKYHEIWDDRAVQVIKNEGIALGEVLR